MKVKNKKILKLIAIIIFSLMLVLAFSNNTYAKTPDEIITGADDFISKGGDGATGIRPENIKEITNIIYNVLLLIGVICIMLIGIILGIKFITEGTEGKAEVKKALVPYVVGCVVVFGAFGIWKLVVDLLQATL